MENLIIEQIYQKGYNLYTGNDSDMKSAQRFLKTAADKGHVEAMYLYAKIIKNGEADSEEPQYVSTDFIKYFKMAADKGHVESMRKYGDCLFYGESIEKDKKKAAEYYKMSADKGNVKAMLSYAYYSLNKNKKETQKYFKMAADNGDVDDVRTYLQIIDHYDIDVDDDERIKYCKKCADMGDEKSMYEYATEIYNDNPEEGAHYYKLSAENGYIKAYSQYGLMLRLGIGVTADKKEAYNYFIKGHEEGNDESSYYAAEMLFIGDGIDADIEKSRELLKKNIENEHPKSCFLYALILYKLEGENADKSKIFEYMKISADGNVKEAFSICGQYYSTGFGTDIDKINALHYYILGVENGDINSMILAGHTYFNGDGVPSDKPLAAKYYKMAADLGDENSKQYYENCMKYIQNPSLLNSIQTKSTENHTLQQKNDENKQLEILKPIENKEYLKEGDLLLRIKFFDAHITPPDESNKYSNPFLIINDSKCTFCCRTSIFRNTLNPVWNEEFNLYVNEDTKMKITFASADLQETLTKNTYYDYHQMMDGYHIILADHKIGDHVVFNYKLKPYDLKPSFGTLHFEYDILKGNTSFNNHLMISSKNSDDERDWEWGKQFY